MKQLTAAWFEFNDVRSDSRHVRLMAMPRRPIAAEQGEQIEIPGRDGYLWSERRDARRPIVIPVECTTTDGYSPQRTAAWLSGSGLLRFSDEPNRAYRARVIDEYVRESMFLRFDAQKFTVNFACQPHRYFYPEYSAERLYSPGVIANPGTADSLPRITIVGSGDMNVYIGGYLIDVSGGSVIVDSELMDCFGLDGVTLANGRVKMDEFPMLLPGGNAVSWSGNVSEIIIDGRWRDL